MCRNWNGSGLRFIRFLKFLLSCANTKCWCKHIIFNWGNKWFIKVLIMHKRKSVMWEIPGRQRGVGTVSKRKSTVWFTKCTSETRWSHYVSLNAWSGRRRRRVGLRSKQEECRYHSSNYCFINGPGVAVNEQLHQSVLTACSLGRHSRFCPQSVDFNLAQKLIIRFRHNLVSCWMWRRKRRRLQQTACSAQTQQSQWKKNTCIQIIILLF